MSNKIRSQVRSGFYHVRNGTLHDAIGRDRGWNLDEAIELLQQHRRLDAIFIYMDQHKNAGWCSWSAAVEIFDLAEEAIIIWGEQACLAK